MFLFTHFEKQTNPNVCNRIQVKRLIKENAVYEKRPSYKRCCWYVHTEMLSRFGQEALPVPCQWTYLTVGAREESNDEPQAATGSQGNSPTTPQNSSTTSASKKRKSTGSMSITKFMKRCTDTEKVEKCTIIFCFIAYACSNVWGRFDLKTRFLHLFTPVCPIFVFPEGHDGARWFPG